MDTTLIIILLVSCTLSFALGRTFVHFRDKKKRKAEDIKKARIQRQQQDEPPAFNKAKRKRQLQRQHSRKSGSL